MHLTNNVVRHRRAFMAGLTSLALVFAACSPAAPAAQPTTAAPTTAPAKPTAAPAATTAPAASPAATAKPAASPASSPAAASPSPAAKQAVTLPKPEKTDIKIARATVEIDSLASKVAEELDLYKKYGFTSAEGFQFEGDAKTVQGVISGQVDVAIMSGGPALTSQITDTPMISVASNSQKVVDMLIGRPDVKSKEDLRGKAVAISSFGGDSHASVVLGLKALGLTADDVTITQIGGQAARIAAVKAGSVAAAPVDEALEADMKAQGFNTLVKLSQSPLRLPRASIIMLRSFVEKNPNTALAIVAANLEGMERIHQDPERTGRIFAEWTQASDQAAAIARVKEAGAGYLNRGLMQTKESFENRREILATQDTAMANIDVEKAFTNRFLDQLKQMGVYDAIGVPKS